MKPLTYIGKRVFLVLALTIIFLFVVINLIGSARACGEPAPEAEFPKPGPVLSKQ